MERLFNPVPWRSFNKPYTTFIHNRDRALQPPQSWGTVEPHLSNLYFFVHPLRMGEGLYAETIARQDNKM